LAFGLSLKKSDASRLPVFALPFSKRERDASLHAFPQDPIIYDLCIVGGGITGAAIARDAALRGLKVLLLEKNDFASGTSSRSSKLVHGGVRYLEQYEFRLVAESTRERAILWKQAPHLVTPLPFLFPAFKHARVPLWKLNAGLWLYDLLALFRNPTLHKIFFKRRTLREEPELRGHDLTGSIFYWDGATDDALLTLANICDAMTLGARPFSRCRVTQIDWSETAAAGQPHVVHFEDELSGTALRARARVVVSATGPWTDAFLQKDAGRGPSKLMATTRGSHFVVPFKRLPCRHAIVIFHPKDGRVLFSIPWSDFTVIGTTDLFDRGSPDSVHMTAGEVDYLLEAANHYFPAARLSRDDVISTWSGLRPLLAPPENAGASQISRDHHIEFHEHGLLIITGGKLTTHREMAKQAVDGILESTGAWSKPLLAGFKECGTRERPLPAFAAGNGAVNAPKASTPLGHSEAARLSEDAVRVMCRTQMILSVEDFMVRRTSIFYKEPRNGWDLLPKLKPILMEELGWNEDEWAHQVADYRDYLVRNVYQPLERTPEL